MQALAQPLLTTIARATPPERARCSRETSTGAACAQVGREDRGRGRRTVRDEQRQVEPLLALMPALTPAARKPCGAVTPPAIVSMTFGH